MSKIGLSLTAVLLVCLSLFISSDDASDPYRTRDILDSMQSQEGSLMSLRQQLLSAPYGLNLLRTSLGVQPIAPSLSERKLNQLLTRRLSPFPRTRIARFSKHLLSLCQQFRFDPIFVLSVIDVESRFRTRAKSEMGALGLMQLMPETAGFITQDLDFKVSGLETYSEEEIQEGIQDPEAVSKLLTDPFVNTTLGVNYLAWLRDRYRGSPFNLLAAYYVGPARMDQLLSRKHFEPVKTKQYFHAVETRVLRALSPSDHRPFECLVDLHRAGCPQAI
jgi:hypothetical protein